MSSGAWPRSNPSVARFGGSFQSCSPIRQVSTGRLPRNARAGDSTRSANHFGGRRLRLAHERPPYRKHVAVDAKDISSKGRAPNSTSGRRGLPHGFSLRRARRPQALRQRRSTLPRIRYVLEGANNHLALSYKRRRARTDSHIPLPDPTRYASIRGVRESSRAFTLSIRTAARTRANPTYQRLVTSGTCFEDAGRDCAAADRRADIDSSRRRSEVPDADCAPGSARRCFARGRDRSPQARRDADRDPADDQIDLTPDESARQAGESFPGR